MKLKKYLINVGTILLFILIFSAPANASTQLVSNNGSTVVSNANPTITNSISGVSKTLFVPNTLTNSYFTGNGSSSIINNNWTHVNTTTNYPYSAIAWVVANFPKGSQAGTAFFVSPYNLLTAGHCVYNKDLGGWATSVRVYPGNNGTYAPYGYFSSSKLYADYNWVNSSDSNAESSTYNPRNDLGAISLNTGVGRMTGFFGINSSITKGSSVVLSGYPGAKFTVSQGVSYGNMWTSKGNVTAVNTDTLSYNNDMSPGDSGSPVYTSNNQVSAVNTEQILFSNSSNNTNVGTRLNGEKGSFVSAFTGYTSYTNVYRLYNPNSGEHFYTTNSTEQTVLVKAGWRYEGVDWFAPTNSKLPIYRLYNPNTGDHFYTGNSAERDSLVKVGWRYEQISFYSDPSNGQAVYRLYNPNAKVGSHFYTTSLAEKNSLVKSGWKYEGVAWYCLS